MAFQAKSVQFPATTVKTDSVAMILKESLKKILSNQLQASYQSMRMSSLVLEN